MLPCKQVAKTLAESNVDDLTGWKRFYIPFHASLCPLCGPFHRDVIKMQHSVRKYAEREDSGPAQLSEEFKAKMKKTLSRK